MACCDLQVFLELGRAFDAVQSAERATQLQAEWAEAHITLSRAQMALGEVLFECSLHHLRLPQALASQ